MKFIYSLLLSVVFIGCQQNGADESTLIENAKAIHKRVITLDTHNDISIKNFTDSINYASDTKSQVNLPKMDEGGLDVSWLIVYTGQDSLNAAGYEKAYANAISKFEAIHRLVEDYAPDKIELALTSDDVRRIDAAGKKVAMIGVENAYPIGLDLSNIKKFHDLGARYMSLSHNGHSQFCDSNTGEKDDVWLYNGLSDLGKEAVAEMNKWGIMIDISHPGQTSIEQMFGLSKAPIIASHSAARALCDVSRNLSDDQLKRLKENGGVIQTVAFTSYLNTEKFNARNEFMSSIYQKVADSLKVKWYEWSEISALDDDTVLKFLEARQNIVAISSDLAKTMADVPPQVDVNDFIDHIDYLVDL
ncbi:MAG: membrane dipeptidase, partial [Flavobacteriaceae bacterium]|nr:membrane dipeptidase [Flavobacteriaceae bacterium]